MARETSTSIVTVSLNTAIDRVMEVPNLQIGGHVRGRLVSVQPAGKAVNVARLLGILGRPCVLTGFVGRGDRERFKRSLAKSRARVEMFEGREPTRENITLVDPEQGVDTHIRDEGFAPSEDDVARLVKKLRILATPGATVAFAGSLPPGMDADGFADLLAVCREQKARVAVDSSGPGLEVVCRDEPFWLVKPNRTELGQLAGRSVETEDDVRAAAACLTDHVERVVVTLGAEGAYLFTADRAWRARPPADAADEVVSTVGCGDAMLAALLDADADGEGPEGCLVRGVAAGTAASREVRAGEVDPEAIEALADRMDVEEL